MASAHEADPGGTAAALWLSLYGATVAVLLVVWWILGRAPDDSTGPFLSLVAVALELLTAPVGFLAIWILGFRYGFAGMAVGFAAGAVINMAVAALITYVVALRPAARRCAGPWEAPPWGPGAGRW
ncbi:hypothetical protein [Nakamurella endophytica]|uniref:Uncharacterized protein n=1 Tax=Nakamurella endophytica TaxID=1748367 RepID=A0A917SUP9_9ACTN|nr:hypothetical protein [Nakamurella endophytica]GGL98418.1 hypothetical protein GCM10011594_17880 [Nakamurella endophytica]